MQLTYLGHAGFCVETRESLILMDPWLSPSGAFDMAWFQYPKNHHMAETIQDLLETSTKEKYIYISHEHQDHFDLAFLTSLRSRDFTLLLAHYDHPVIHNTLKRMNYVCKKIVILKNEEKFSFNDGELYLFIMDTELNCDSAILLKSESSSFLNLNDAKLHDKLASMVKDYGPIDVFTAQFSGASWYPTCYSMSEDQYRRRCEEKITSKFEAIAQAISTVRPKIYLPSAGPPCFLDPMLLSIHFQAINTYPRAAPLIAYLNKTRREDLETTQYPNLQPGDQLDVHTLKITWNSADQTHDFETYVRSYAAEYKKIFTQRAQQHAKIDAHDVFERLQHELEQKIDTLGDLKHDLKTLLYWRLTESEQMYCIDLQHKTIKITSSIDDPTHYYRITAPAWLVDQVLKKKISWSECALTFRVTLERVPDVYHTLLHGFLILDVDKIHSFAQKMQMNTTQKERIIIEHKGQKYSILRYCPHQGADLSQALFKDNCLICPRHQWAFDLEHHGQCKDKHATIDAIPLPPCN